MEKLNYELANRKLATWLKTLYETTKTKSCRINLSKETRECGLAFYQILPTVLYNKGIIKKLLFKRTMWNSVEPNIHMAEAILNECRNYIKAHPGKRKHKQSAICKISLQENDKINRLRNESGLGEDLYIIRIAGPDCGDAIIGLTGKQLFGIDHELNY